MRYSLALSYLLQSVSAISLSVDSSGGNSSSQLLYGVLYEVLEFSLNLTCSIKLMSLNRIYTTLEMAVCTES
jgi:hypothetical protein